MLNKGWSPDMVVGHATKENTFTSDLTSRTSTFYHWIHRGIMKIKNNQNNFFGHFTSQNIYYL